MNEYTWGYGPGSPKEDNRYLFCEEGEELKPSELSYQYIAFQLAEQEKIIQAAVGRKKELLEELASRAEQLREINRRGEIPFERGEFE